MAKKNQISMGHSKIPYVLGLIGGIFTVLIALVILVQLYNAGTTELVFGIWGTLVGAVMIVGSVMLLQEDRFKMGSTILIVSGALALITLQGLIVGPVVGLLGGILTHSRKMI